jgi:hypothetical protein
MLQLLGSKLACSVQLTAAAHAMGPRLGPALEADGLQISTQHAGSQQQLSEQIVARKTVRVYNSVSDTVADTVAWTTSSKAPITSITTAVAVLSLLAATPPIYPFFQGCKRFKSGPR